MKTVLAAAIALSALSVGSAWAETWNGGRSMLEVSVARELTGPGLDGVDPTTLTLNQLARIKSIADSSDYNPAEMASAIRQAVTRTE